MPSIYCFLAGALIALVAVGVLRIFYPHKIIKALNATEADFIADEEIEAKEDEIAKR